jgi:multidrug efflux pump subunit AcrA (membrane-fusion protein)
VNEGDAVGRGQVLARMQSLNQAGASEEAAALMAASQADVVTAELHHSGLGEALAAQQAARGSSAIAQEEGATLTLTAPADGVVTTMDPQNLVNREVTTGQTLLTIVNRAGLAARLYVPVSAMDRARTGDPVSLQLASQFREIHGRLGVLEGAAMPLPQGLMEQQQYKGLGLPAFYTTLMPLREDGIVRPGMSGQAKIFGRRRSVAERTVIALGDMLHTHFW